MSFSEQKGTQCKWRAEVILGALLFSVTPSGCVLPDNDFPEPLKWLASSVYSRLSMFSYSLRLFQKHLSLSCNEQARQPKIKGSLKDWLLGVRSRDEQINLSCCPIISVQLFMRTGCKLMRDLFKAISYSVLKFQDTAGVLCLAAELFIFHRMFCPVLVFLPGSCSVSCLDLLQLYNGGIFILPYSHFYTKQNWVCMCIYFFFSLHVPVAILAITGQYLVTSWRLEKKVLSTPISLIEFSALKLCN